MKRLPLFLSSNNDSFAALIEFVRVNNDLECDLLNIIICYFNHKSQKHFHVEKFELIHTLTVIRFSIIPFQQRQSDV